MSVTKVNATINQRKLEKSIRRYAKQFGESSAQAVTRWSVQTCRELAKYTQPFGKNTAQRKPIWKDALNCVIPLKGRQPRGLFALKTPQEIIDWIDVNRIRRGRRVPKLPVNQRKKCSMDNLKRAIEIKSKQLGMAKGGWIGAGQQIARNQIGTNRINIRSNFISYAHKFANLGTATPPTNGFKPVATTTNKARHGSTNYVLRMSQIKRAIADGRKNTLKFYKNVLNKINNKKP